MESQGSLLASREAPAEYGYTRSGYSPIAKEEEEDHAAPLWPRHASEQWCDGYLGYAKYSPPRLPESIFDHYWLFCREDHLHSRFRNTRGDQACCCHHTSHENEQCPWHIEEFVAALQWALSGLALYWDTMLTACAISGPEMTKYMRLLRHADMSPCSLVLMIQQVLYGYQSPLVLALSLRPPQETSWRRCWRTLVGLLVVSSSTNPVGCASQGLPFASPKSLMLGASAGYLDLLNTG